MGIDDTKHMEEDMLDERQEFEATKDVGRTFITGKAKYIGGHANIAGEASGRLTVTSKGVFFECTKENNFFFIPVESILKAESKTLDEVAKHAVFARYLALSGFALAFKKRLQGTPVFFTVDYASFGIECSALFEAETANAFAVAAARGCEDYQKRKKEEEVRIEKEKEKEKEREKGKEDNGRIKVEHKSIAEMMIDINDLFARGVLTPDEFTQKKRDLLSRM